MNLSILSNNTNFTSKAEIRRMDNLMRQANLAYPRISPYKVGMRLSGKSVPARYADWLDKIGKIVDAERVNTTQGNFISMILNATKVLKKNKLGDCGESSLLMLSTLLSNGYKDGKVARLFFEATATDMNTKEEIGKKMIDTTHEFVVRNAEAGALTSDPKTYGKNLVVIDAWDGFCSNMQEAFKRYYDLFFGGERQWVNSADNVIISYKPKFDILKLDDFSSRDVEIFKDTFPELIKK